LKLLSFSGAAAVFLLAVVIYASGGWELTLPILTFVILSSAMSRLGRARKRRLDTVFEKGSTRDLRQVAANGGVAGLIAVLYVLRPDTAWQAAYLGSVAAVTADTWSTELGVLLSNRPRHLLTMRPVPRGTSGGVSPAGTLGGALGALLIALAGAAFQPEILLKPLPLVLFTLAGVAASLVDSLIGATVQAQYRCGACGAVTEKRTHCGAPALLRSGRRWITNDVVNTACAGAGAVLGWLVGFFL